MWNMWWTEGAETLVQELQCFLGTKEERPS